MADEMKNNVTGNEVDTQETKEQENTNPTPEATTEEVKKDGIFKRIGSGIKKNWKKALIPVGVAAGFAAGICADKYGIPVFKKKQDDQAGDPEE